MLLKLQNNVYKVHFGMVYCKKELLKEFDLESDSSKHSPEAHGFFSKAKDIWEDLKLKE